jgi:hypothetical protein
MKKKKFKFFKRLFFFAVFIALIFLIGLLVIVFREDENLCSSLIDYLCEFYYKNISSSDEQFMMYMEESYDIYEPKTDYQWWYYTRGPEEGIAGPSGSGHREATEGGARRGVRRAQSRITRGGGSSLDQVGHPIQGNIRQPQIFPGYRDYIAESEQIIEARKQSFSKLKSLIRYTNVTIFRQQPTDLHNYKVVNVPNKTYYIKRDSFYNGDRETVNLLLKELRNFHFKGYEFSRIEFKMEPRIGRPLGFANKKMDTELRWFLNEHNPYNPDFRLPNLFSFNEVRFGFTRSPSPSPFLSSSSSEPYNPIKDKMDIYRTLNQNDLERQERETREQRNEVWKPQPNVERENADGTVVLREEWERRVIYTEDSEREDVQGNIERQEKGKQKVEEENIERQEKGKQREEQIRDNSNLIEQDPNKYKKVQNEIKRISINSLIEQTDTNKNQNENKKISISSLIEQSKK